MIGMVVPSRRHFSEENMVADLALPLLEFKDVVMATDNFSDSNKLGEGGFGIVYKVEITLQTDIQSITGLRLI